MSGSQHKMMMVRSYLAPSDIEGLGVFSHANIRKGQLVWLFDSRFDTSFFAEEVASAPKHFREFLERYSYPHPQDPERMVLDSDEGRFMNHSDDAAIDMLDGLRGIARREIGAGEEITRDYRQFEAWTQVFKPSRHRIGAQVMAAE